ncbi:MAG: YIP1 family protein [Betaproteobacteria bacterium]
MGILNRIKGMMLNPQAEWENVAREMPGATEMLRNVLLPLSLLAPAATVVGILVFDTRWHAQYGYSMLPDRAPFIALATCAFEIISVYLLAGVFYVLARSERQSPDFLVALRVALFGSIPVLLSGAMLFIPVNIVFSLVAIMYSFYLYYLGAARLIGIRPADATMFVGVAMVCMMVLSSLLGGLAAALGLV